MKSMNRLGLVSTRGDIDNVVVRNWNELHSLRRGDMGILSRFFRSPDAGSTAESGNAKAFEVNGGISDLQQAAQLAEQSRWEPALAIVERVIPIPDDAATAITGLRGFMDSSDGIVNVKIELTSLDETRHTGTMGLEIGGGMIPEVMRLRGRCINGALLDLLKSLGPTANPSSNSTAVALRRKGLIHADIVWNLLPDDSDAHVISGLLLLTVCQFRHAVKFFDRALHLDAGNVHAREMFDLAKKRLAESSQ